MAKKKGIELKTEQATVYKVGYLPSTRTTVVYVTGQGESQGVNFRLTVDKGGCSNYEDNYTRTLVGRVVVYSYESIDDMRAPVGSEFLEFVDKN